MSTPHQPGLNQPSPYQSGNQQPGQPQYGQIAPSNPYGQQAGYTQQPYVQQRGYGYPQQAGYGFPGQVSPSERTTAMWAHIGLVLTGWIVPLILFATKKNESPFIREHSRQALNHALTMVFAMLAIEIVSLILMFVVIGFFTIWLIFVPTILMLVFGIIGATKANKGEMYDYPLTFNLVK